MTGMSGFDHYPGQALVLNMTGTKDRKEDCDRIAKTPRTPRVSKKKRNDKDGVAGSGFFTGGNGENKGNRFDSSSWLARGSQVWLFVFFVAILRVIGRIRFGNIKTSRLAE
jgi:hypothetical protein